MIKNAYQRLELILYYLVISAFCILGLLHILTGYADNGDFSRSIGFIFERPEGFSSLFPPADSTEYKQRFFSSWHDKWIFLPQGLDITQLWTLSSYKIYLLFQVFLSSLISDDELHYSLIIGSMFSRCILYGTFFLSAIYIRKEASKIAGWIFIVFTGFILIDSNWIAFLNSFYEEQIAILFLPILGILLLRLYLNDDAIDVKEICSILLFSVFIASAKTAYFYLPTLLGLFLLPIIHKKKLITSCLIILLSQSIAFIPVYLGKHENINSYHALYYGALRTIPQSELSTLQFIGKKHVIKTCIGIHAFSPEGEKCLQATNTSYSDVIKLMIDRPSTIVKMFSYSLNQGKQTNLEYLGKGISSAPNFAPETIFNIYSKIFSKGINGYLLLAMLPIFTLSISYIKKGFINGHKKSLIIAGLFFTTLGFSQYIVALGDGYYEMTKHLIIGNYALAISLPFSILSVIYLINAYIKNQFSR